MPDTPPPAITREGPGPAGWATRPVRGAIWLYQHTVSPALAAANPFGGCRFAPTCSHYAAEALREHGLATGLALTARRLAKCGPWHPGGIDPVPPRPRPVCTPVGRRA